MKMLCNNNLSMRDCWGINEDNLYWNGFRRGSGLRRWERKSIRGPIRLSSCLWKRRRRVVISLTIIIIIIIFIMTLHRRKRRIIPHQKPNKLNPHLTYNPHTKRKSTRKDIFLCSYCEKSSDWKVSRISRQFSVAAYSSSTNNTHKSSAPNPNPPTSPKSTTTTDILLL